MQKQIPLARLFRDLFPPSGSVGSRRCVALSLLSALLASQPRSFFPLVRSQDHPEEIGAGISGRDDSVSITSRLLES